MWELSSAITVCFFGMCRKGNFRVGHQSTRSRSFILWLCESHRTSARTRTRLCAHSAPSVVSRWFCLGGSADTKQADYDPVDTPNEKGGEDQLKNVACQSKSLSVHIRLGPLIPAHSRIFTS